MDYPIYLSGQRAGTLSIEADGLYTCFRARCSDPGRPLHLWVYGGGREAPLGVPLPEGGELVLSRRFTRRELAAFPAELEYAAPAGERLPSPAAAEPVAAEAQESSELIWYSSSDGTLRTRYQGHSYLALPLSLCAGKQEPMLEQRCIEGREYGVFDDGGA